jgi:HAMP domain-containing protein
LPIVAIIAFLIVLGAVLSFLLAQWIVQPIVGLTEIADKLTRGNLEASVGRNWLVSPDEIGDLARSLERMRSSLKAAIVRLSRDVA